MFLFLRKFPLFPPSSFVRLSFSLLSLLIVLFCLPCNNVLFWFTKLVSLSACVWVCECICSLFIHSFVHSRVCACIHLQLAHVFAAWCGSKPCNTCALLDSKPSPRSPCSIFVCQVRKLIGRTVACAATASAAVAVVVAVAVGATSQRRFMRWWFTASPCIECVVIDSSGTWIAVRLGFFFSTRGSLGCFFLLLFSFARNDLLFISRSSLIAPFSLMRTASAGGRSEKWKRSENWNRIEQ